jgi:hypothetical protein
MVLSNIEQAALSLLTPGQECNRQIQFIIACRVYCMGKMSLFRHLTVLQVIDLIGGYQDVGSQLMILSNYKNNFETLELFAAKVMPKFG